MGNFQCCPRVAGHHRNKSIHIIVFNAMLTISAFFHQKLICCFGCYTICLASEFFIYKSTWLVSEKVKFRLKTTCITVAHCMLCCYYESIWSEAVVVASGQKIPALQVMISLTDVLLLIAPPATVRGHYIYPASK